MRILTVSHFFASHGGGIERVAGQMAARFAALGHDAPWAASDRDPPPATSVEAVPLACRDPLERLCGLPMPIPGPRALRGLARAVAAADAVVIHDALYLTSIAALVLARRRGKPVVLVQHIAAIPFASRLLRGVMALANRIVTRPMLRAASHVVFISATVRDELLGRPAWRDSTLAFNGVDSTLFHPGPAPVNPRRTVLFVGRFVAKKGLAVLRALAERCPGTDFLLAGQGPIRPADWGLANVRELGPQTPAALAAHYRAADLLLLPSVGEGFPLVIQEAMACGLPVICGAPADRADPQASRWLHGVAIDLGDPQATAIRCGEALTLPPLTSADRADMAAYAAEAYDWDRQAAVVLGLLESAIQGGINPAGAPRSRHR